MKRNVFAILGIVAILAIGSAVFFTASGQQNSSHRHGSDNEGTIKNATVSFGGWMTATPIDRFPNNANTQFPRTMNHHRLTPQIAKIKVGGTVNFIIGGFHVVTVYDDGTTPQDIDVTRLVPQPHPGPPIIDDSRRRIYRGLDPTLLPAIVAQDRVEVIHFDKPGRYLVICSVLPHFQEGMYGYVNVVKDDDDDNNESR